MLIDEDAQRCLTAMRDVTHVKLPGVGHMIHSTRSQELLTLVMAFLESLDGVG